MKSQTNLWSAPGASPRLVVCLAILFVANGLARVAPTDKQCGEEIVRPLLEVIRDRGLQESDPGSVRDAMKKLGSLRCANAIDDLMELLTFRFPYPKPGDPVSLQPQITGVRYPATDALTEIGKPALPALVKVIETSDADSLLSKNARYTVRAIFAYREKEADPFFREAADKATTPEGKQRLLKALETAAQDLRSD